MNSSSAEQLDISTIQQLIEQNKTLTESQLIALVADSIKVQGTLKKMDNGSEETKKMFTVIWYDYDKQESDMCYVEAESSIAAIEQGYDKAPSCANISAYQTMLPRHVKFHPNDAF